MQQHTTSRYIRTNNTPRIPIDQSARFLTFSCFKRHQLLSDPDDRDIVAHHITTTFAHFQATLHAWVVMPEHVHILGTPQNQAEITPILTSLKRRSAKAILARWRSANHANLTCPFSPEHPSPLATRPRLRPHHHLGPGTRREAQLHRRQPVATQPPAHSLALVPP
jgi:REP element-mobilizing transposase RayT